MVKRPRWRAVLRYSWFGLGVFIGAVNLLGGLAVAVFGDWWEGALQAALGSMLLYVLVMDSVRRAFDTHPKKG